MKFAHMADCHIGGWPDQKLKELGIEAFKKAVGICIKEHVGFILISGDLFNTALPQIELIREVAKTLNKVREHDINVYVVPGSHDFSPSGKTMLDVLEKAGLCENVYKHEGDSLKFTIDKTGAKITGMLGRRGGLEKNDYKGLNTRPLEEEGGFKIFMFHSALTELKSEDLEKVESQPLSSLPKNFSYYAGGHVHEVEEGKYGNGIVTEPGALFPNSFREMERLGHGGFFIVNDKLDKKWIPIKVKDVKPFYFNAENKSAEDIQSELVSELRKADIKDKIVTIRVEGTLARGKPSDINFNDVLSRFPEAYAIMKNTSKLSSKEFVAIKAQSGTTKEIEERIIKEMIPEIKGYSFGEADAEEAIQKLMISLDEEKAEGEKKADFEKRLIANIIKVMGLEGVLGE